MLTIAGANDKAQQLARGQHTEVVDWFRNHVSVWAHGANAGQFGLDVDQTRQFNPIAQRVGLMSPGRLWTPEDELPADVQPGDIVDYSVTPDWGSLPEKIFEANETIVVDATVDGSIGRIDTGIGATLRSSGVEKMASGN